MAPDEVITAESGTDFLAPGAGFEETGEKGPAGAGPWKLAWRRLRRDKAGLFFGVLFLALVAACIAAPLWAELVALTTPDENHLTDTIHQDGETVNVVGRHCESGDQLIEGVALRDPVIGDLLAVPVTGAYCYTMSNQYNGARRVPVVFARNGNARLVVRRDTWDDLLIRDVD